MLDEETYELYTKPLPDILEFKISEFSSSSFSEKELNHSSREVEFRYHPEIEKEMGLYLIG